MEEAIAQSAKGRARIDKANDRVTKRLVDMSSSPTDPTGLGSDDQPTAKRRPMPWDMPDRTDDPPAQSRASGSSDTIGGGADAQMEVTQKVFGW